MALGGSALHRVGRSAPLLLTRLEGTYRLANTLGRGLLAALGTKIRISGSENLPKSGPMIVAANHISYVDFLVIGKVAASRGRYVRFLARYDTWTASTGWAMSGMGHIPVNRAAPAGALLEARARLREGEVVGLFPEAGISYSFTVRSMMKGAAALSRDTDIPVIPVAMWGAQRIYTVGIPEPKPDLTRNRLIDVVVGEPMAPQQDLTAFTCALGERLTQMLEGLQTLPEHRPQPGERALWYPAHLGGHAPTREEAREFEPMPKSAIAPTWGPL